MPHPCVVCGRSRMNPKNREEDYMFFGFPANDEPRCLRWLEFCCREDLYKLTKKQLLQRMVCSKHFRPADFLYVDRLQATAIPSVYDPKQSLYNIACVLCGRARKDPPPEDYDGTTFHHFPGEEFRCLEWLDFVGDESYYRLTRKEILFCYICSKHFDPSQFVPGYKGRLVDGAVPSIRDPDEPGREQPPEVVRSEEDDAEPALFVNAERSDDPPLAPEVLESQACAACGRLRSDPRNKAERYRFHPFPAYEIGRCLRWCQFLGREDLLKMSPNQIRKLVLCSKHFETSQKFRNGGPCDAVPTIKEVSESSDVDREEENNDDEQAEEEAATAKDPTTRVIYRYPRALVSSKKPKIDNRPTPLAKKRGKSRRPTSINIPKLPSGLENWGRKLPLPPTTNWKINLDQLQPITINNVTSNVVNSLQGDVKKIILPFAGDIANLGSPIPVHSLSSIPPGLLIKINLPEQKQQQQQQQQQGRSLIKRKTRQSKKSAAGKSAGKSAGEPRKTRAKRKAVAPESAKPKKKAKKTMEFLTMSPELADGKVPDSAPSRNAGGAQAKEKAVTQNSTESREGEKNTQVEEDRYLRECKKVKVAINRRKAGCHRVTGTMRRTMIPITGEIGRFFRKLTPLMHRLPTRARATLKLSIVNMVIDKL